MTRLLLCCWFLICLAVTESYPQNIVTIPVVVHIVWKDPIDNLSASQISSQIERINLDYRAQNEDIDLVPAQFETDVADMEIQFCLAERDPNNLPTNGIVRVRTTIDDIGTASTQGKRRICYSELGGSDAWDPNHYLNIWVGQREGFAGEASFPGADVLAEDGIRIAPNRFGTNGTVEAPYDLGRTLTHEIGHYLNLQHLWGVCSAGSTSNPLCCTNPNTGCNCDDGISDTPTLSRTYLGECQLDRNNNSCVDVTVPVDKFDMSMNYMTFSDDACMILFTKGQKEVVWQTLNGPRQSLLASLGCQMPSSALNNSAKNLEVNLYPNPTQSTLMIEMDRIVDAFSWQLLNIQGQIIKEDQATSLQTPISLLPLSNGVYYIRISIPNEGVITRKILIAH